MVFPFNLLANERSMILQVVLQVIMPFILHEHPEIPMPRSEARAPAIIESLINDRFTKHLVAMTICLSTLLQANLPVFGCTVQLHLACAFELQETIWIAAAAAHDPACCLLY
mmetsp:Transcript_42953/g.103954  ORF Transcript_42953/g.103954 Transcript_42953/m.103954 type:complete len:112 (-) Transcript_42953:1699-2034(-)